MNDERLVRDIWKQLPPRPVVGARLVRAVGSRGWERPRFARFRRFFERCGVPDPWDPGVGDVDIGLGEVGIAQRKQVAPHAAPPTPAGPKPPGFANVPRAPAAPPPEARAPVDGKPAPRIGETRKDDTAILKKKLAESERLKADPARANAYKVQQPVAKLPQRPDLAGDGAARPTPRPAARPGDPPRSPPAPRPGGPSAGPRPAAAGSGRPFRMPIEPARRLPDGPEELPETPPEPARPAARGFGDFGLGGGWDDDDIPVRPERPAPPPVSYAVDAEPPKAAVQAPVTTPPVAPPRAAPPATPPTTPPAAARPSPAPSSPAPSSPAASPPRPAPAPPASTPPSAPPRPTAPPAAAPRPSEARPSPASAPPRPSAEPPRPTPAATPPKPGAPPPRPQKPGGGGLDDLFGMGAGDNTRFRMPKREDAADASKPRRPMVTPDADLGKAGIDRRPPPPKPPAVTPTGGPSRSMPDPDGDGGD